MKRLILLRHAKSSWSDDRLADAERPLAGRGERDAPRMGARLHEHGIRPDLVLSSPALRARRTAVLVARAVGYPEDAIRLEDLLYLAAPDDILAVVAAQPDTAGCVLVVGHNPGLTELANLLVPGLDLANLPTAGAVVVDCTADRWAEIPNAPRLLAYYDYPKNRGPGARAN